MLQKDYLSVYISKLADKITKFDLQWKGTRFASVEESELMEIEDENENEVDEEYLEKYRGKNGSIKPLGLLLYKKYLCYMFLLYLGLTLLFVPVAMVYSMGDGLSKFQTSSSFSKSILLLSIANVPHYRLDDLSASDLSQISLIRYLTLTTDFIAICVIFSFLIFMKINFARITIDYMAQSPAPNLYCLEVENLEGCTEHDVVQHFRKLGRISQLSGIYTYKNIIFDIRKIVKLVTFLRNVKPDQALYQKTKQKIRVKYLQLAESYFKMPKPQLKSAFICFDKIVDRNRIHDLYYYKINPKKLSIKIENHSSTSSNKFLIDKTNLKSCESFGNTTEMKQSTLSTEHQQQLQNQTTKNNISSSQKINLIVKKCNFQPLTINWQNCDIDKRSQNIKFLCQFLLLVIVAFVILLGLFLVNISSTHVKQQAKSSTSSNIDFDGDDQLKQKYTFCASLSLSEFKWQYYNLCSQYFQNQRNRFVLIFSFALMVALINLLTNRILWALVAFRRYRTLAKRNSFLITSIFLFSLINGAILILLIRGHYTGPILRAIVGKIFNFQSNQLQVAVYSQFNRKWYMNIGSQLMMNFVISLIMFPNFHILLHWFRSKYRKFMSKRSQKQRRKPVFNYCTFYAMSLKVTFFVLMYSNSMPIFYLLGCLAFGAQIYVGRILLHKFVDQPVFVDNQAIQVTMNKIPYALVLHCVTSILFLNVQEMFPAADSYSRIHGSWKQTNLFKLQRGFGYILMLIILLVYILNSQRFDNKVVSYWLGRSENNAECDQTKKFKDIKNNPAFLGSYRMKDNPKYKVLDYALRLFVYHMQKLREKGGISKIGDDSSMYTSYLINQQITQNAIRKMSSQITNNFSDLHTQTQNSNRKDSLSQEMEVKSQEEQQQEGRNEEILTQDDVETNHQWFLKGRMSN